MEGEGNFAKKSMGLLKRKKTGGREKGSPVPGSSIDLKREKEKREVGKAGGTSVALSSAKRLELAYRLETRPRSLL